MRIITSNEFSDLVPYGDTAAFGYHNGTEFMTSNAIIDDDDALHDFISAEDEGLDIYLYDMSTEEDNNLIDDYIREELIDELIIAITDTYSKSVLAEIRHDLEDGDCKIAEVTNDDGLTTYMLWAC